MTNVDLQKLFIYWKNEADYSDEIRQILFRKKKYPECLFFGHLTVEKILKALYVAKFKKHAPLIHDLVKSSKAVGLPFSAEELADMASISRFNIAGRYDHEKQTFRKKCTAAFAKHYHERITHYYVWLKEWIKKTDALSPSA